MSSDEKLDDHARQLIDANRYLTLGTVDSRGVPWVTPVFFATADHLNFYWLSRADAEHSRNLARQPQVSAVIFDSTVPAYHGRALYLTGTAHEVPDAELGAALDAYPGPDARGGTPVTRADVSAPEPYRLYLATAEAYWVLCPREPQRPCPLHGIVADHRAEVSSAVAGGSDD